MQDEPVYTTDPKTVSLHIPVDTREVLEKLREEISKRKGKTVRLADVMYDAFLLALMNVRQSGFAPIYQAYEWRQELEAQTEGGVA